MGSKFITAISVLLALILTIAIEAFVLALDGLVVSYAWNSFMSDVYRLNILQAAVLSLLLGYATYQYNPHINANHAWRMLRISVKLATTLGVTIAVINLIFNGTLKPY